MKIFIKGKILTKLDICLRNHFSRIELCLNVNIIKGLSSCSRGNSRIVLPISLPYLLEFIKHQFK